MLSNHKLNHFTEPITALPTEPKIPADELKRRFQAPADEVRSAHNALIDALSSSGAAREVGFQPSAGLPASNIQHAVEHLQSQIVQTALGQLPDGSISSNKLGQDVRDRLASIEATAAAEAATRQNADSALEARINQMDLGKCEIIVGSYTGNGQSTQFISLGRTPKAVLQLPKYPYTYYGNRFLGGLALQGNTSGPEEQAFMSIVDNGFQVYGATSFNLSGTNNSNSIYFYIAFL